MQAEAARTMATRLPGLHSNLNGENLRNLTNYSWDHSRIGLRTVSQTIQFKVTISDHTLQFLR